MESNNSENENLTPDDSQETEPTAPEVKIQETEPTASEVKQQDAETPQPTPAAKDDDLDFDVRPADTYLGPDYDPKKPSRTTTTMWLGVLMVAAIIGLTWYAFRSQSGLEPGYETAVGKTPAASAPTTATVSDAQSPSLPEKAPDAADFSPTPETEASAASLPATTSSSTPPTPARDRQSAPAPAATAKAADSAKTGTATKPTASAKASSKNDVKSNAAKPSEAKSAATSSKPAESKAASAKTTAQPAAMETKSGEAKPDTSSIVSNETQKAGETKANEAKPEEAQKPDGNVMEGAASSTEAQSASVTTTDGAQATPAPGATAAAGEISNLWVINISSTPDATESIRLLNRVNAMDVGGQVYFYETTIDGRVHHRIRIGFFETRGEAEAVGQKVKEDFKLSATPWAVKPTVEEVDRYKKK